MKHKNKPITLYTSYFILHTFCDTSICSLFIINASQSVHLLCYYWATV